MPGFVRRFNFVPGTEVITLIEGVIILDLPPPGSVQGAGVGTAGLVGEFADMTSAVAVDPTTGAVTTKPQPFEVFSGQDLADKAGGFDETLGDFGGAMGNGFVELRNKQFSRLILVPVNLASAKGIREWRVLPTNKSAVDPSPVVPLQAGTVVAAREFKFGANRVRSAKRVVFTSDGPRQAKIDGVVVPVGLPAATQIVTSAAGDFINTGVKEGDAIVLDVINNTTTTVTAPMGAADVVANVGSTAGFPTSGVLLIDAEQMSYSGVTALTFTGLIRGINGTVAAIHLGGTSVTLVNVAGTYRVVSVGLATSLTIERQDGSNFTATNWLATVSLPYRVHPAAAADTGGEHQLSEAGGYLIPARPLDATIAIATLLTPSVIPPVATATTWDPLSGLTARTDPATGLTFTAAIQAVNAANSASLDALYLAAFDSLITDNPPGRDVNLLWAARKSANIRLGLKNHVALASSQGVGRVGYESPDLETVALATVLGDADPGVGQSRQERLNYNWPGVQTFVPEAVNINIMGADGVVHSDGLVDTTFDGWNACVCSVLAPERNPGQGTPPATTALAPIVGLQRGAIPNLAMNEYIALRNAGVAAPRFERSLGQFVIQSGITTSLISGQKNQNRRRMADFIEDSLAGRLVQFAKEPLTESLKDAAAGEVDAFLDSLLSPNNPPAQRISSYSIDLKSGNTPALEAKGIFVIIVNVRTLATADFIVLQANIGEGVVTVTAA